MVYPRYDLMIGDLREVQQSLEQSFFTAQPGIEQVAQELYKKDPQEAVRFLTGYTNQMAQSAFESWKKLGEFLVVKYNDGVTKRVKNGRFERNAIGQPARVIRQGYPEDFLKEYVRQTGERYKVN